MMLIDDVNEDTAPEVTKEFFAKAIPFPVWLLNNLSKEIYEENKAKGFWDSERNVGELLMLITSELSEGLEAHRKNQMDDHLPKYPGLQVELADALIRILDMCGGLNIPIGEILAAKRKYNQSRPHKHGKAY